MPGKYASPRAFRHALDDRLRTQSVREGIDLQRLQRRVAFERLLARLFAQAGDKPLWILKGGYSLELRLHETARATVDLDLSIPSPGHLVEGARDPMAAIRDLLQIAIERDLGDSFTFFLRASSLPLQAPIYGGTRFSVDARLDGRPFASFHLDVALGDAIVSNPEWISGHDLLGFAGIPPVRVAALPVEQHFAEKIHAYTLPRTGEPNTRIKDLVDLVLLIDLGLPDPQLVARAVRATFDRRKTHEIPATPPEPPAEWEGRYASIASECGVSKGVLQSAVDYLAGYWASLPL